MSVAESPARRCLSPAAARPDSGLSLAPLGRLVAAGERAAYQVHRRVLFDIADLDAPIRSRRAAAPT
jgi:hypothetical protein